MSAATDRRNPTRAGGKVVQLAFLLVDMALSTNKIGDLQTIRDSWLSRVEARKDTAVWAALPVVMAQPAATVNHLANKLGVSFTSAQNAVDQMVKARVLTPVSTQERNRVWTANEVVEALDDFAARVGKRRLGR